MLCFSTNKKDKGNIMLAPYRQKVIEFTQPLLMWQKLYFLALAIGLYKLVFSNDDVSDFTLVGFVALMALSVEMWPKFVEIWETLLGRVIVVIVYAIIGNFVVVFARHQLNEIVGVDPGTLFYATSFVSLITAPVWIITITLIVMFIYMIVKQLWFIITFVPWLIGLYEKTNNQVAMYPKLTRITRIVMVPFMFMFLISILQLYGDEDTVENGAFNELTSGIVEGIEGSHKTKVSESISSEEVSEEAEKPENEDELGKEANSESETLEPEKEVASKENIGKDPLQEKNEIELENNNVTFLTGKAINETIAEFVYYFEAFGHSQCVKEEDERVISIGEYDILVVRRDKNSEFGFHFSVRECKLKSYSSANNE